MCIRDRRSTVSLSTRRKNASSSTTSTYGVRTLGAEASLTAGMLTQLPWPDDHLDLRTGRDRRGCRTPAPPNAGSTALLVELDEVSAGIGEDGDPDRAGVSWLPGEDHPPLAQPPVLGPEVVHLERGHRNALLEERFLERSCRGVLVGLERQLQILRTLGRGDGDPPVLPDREVLTFHEPERVRVEGQRPGLVLSLIHI